MARREEKRLGVRSLSFPVASQVGTEAPTTWPLIGSSGMPGITQQARSNRSSGQSDY